VDKNLVKWAQQMIMDYSKLICPARSLEVRTGIVGKVDHCNQYDTFDISTPALAPTFDIFIDQQPEHIAALLPPIQWYCQDAYDFCDQASDLSDTRLVTDRGAADNMATFGSITGKLLPGPP
jgi:hypothetical protein